MEAQGAGLSEAAIKIHSRAVGTGGAMAPPVFSEGPKRSIGLLYKSEVGIMNLSHSNESFFLEK